MSDIGPSGLVAGPSPAGPTTRRLAAYLSISTFVKTFRSKEFSLNIGQILLWFVRLAIGAAHKLWGLIMIGCVDHVIHHSSPFFLAVDWPRVRVFVSEFFLHALAEQESAKMGIHPLKVSEILASPPTPDFVLIGR